MKATRLLTLLTSIILLVSTLLTITACDGLDGFFVKGPVTVDQLNGKTLKDLYGSSINKYKHDKENGVPFTISFVWTTANGERVDVTFKRDGGKLDFSIREDEIFEEIIYISSEMYYKNTSGRYKYTTKLDVISAAIFN